MGLHGPDCTCNESGDNPTVTSWVYLFTADDLAPEDAYGFADATLRLYSAGTLPGMVVYAAHTALCLHDDDPDWLPSLDTLPCFGTTPNPALADLLTRALPAVQELFRAVRGALALGDLRKAVRAAGDYLYRSAVENDGWEAGVLAYAMLVAESAMTGLVELSRLGRYAWQHLADRPIKSDGSPMMLPMAPVAVGLARMSAAVVEQDHELMAQLFQRYVDEGYLVPIMHRAVDEMAAGSVPGQEPVLMELDMSGPERIPNRMIDPLAALGPDQTPDVQAAGLAASWVQRRINGEKLTDDMVPDGTDPDVASMAAVAVIQSYAWAMQRLFNAMQAYHEGQTAA